MLSATSSAGPVAYISLLLWIVVLVSYGSSALRYIRGPYNLLDSYRTAMFFMAALWVGGLGRLIFMPSAEQVRMAILALSCALAVYLLVLARQGSIR